MGGHESGDGMQVFEARKGTPGHRRLLKPQDLSWNTHDEASTANRAGRRGDRDSLNVDIAPNSLFQSSREVTQTDDSLKHP